MGMPKKAEPPKLLWLTYRHSDGRAARALVIESRGLLHARLKASLTCPVMVWNLTVRFDRL
jgi:hypothetical protein